MKRYPAERAMVPVALTDILLDVRRLGVLEEERLARLELALEEILVNICNHAYTGLDVAGDRRGFAVEVRSSPGRVVVEIVDSGRAFDPTSLVSPDTAAGLEERPIGGLGIHLVRTMVDGMEYRREGSRNLLNLIMDAAAAEEGS